MAIAGALPYIQVVLSVLVVVCVLLQQTAASLGGAFGGNDNFSATYHTRRGFEKHLFYATIVLGVLLAGTSFLAFIIQ
jgi:protein translocase SecG subunit